MDAPTVDRPDMPDDYGPHDHLDGVLEWSWAEERLAASRNCWVATTTADGAPHVAPVRGAWVAGALWSGTGPESAKGRHLARDPRVVVNLESGDEVVIVHGRAARVPVADVDADLRTGSMLRTETSTWIPRRASRCGSPPDPPGPGSTGSS